MDKFGDPGESGKESCERKRGRAEGVRDAVDSKLITV